MARLDNQKSWLEIPSISEIIANKENLLKFSLMAMLASFFSLQLLFIIEIVMKAVMYLSGITFICSLAYGRSEINLNLGDLPAAIREAIACLKRKLVTRLVRE